MAAKKKRARKNKKSFLKSLFDLRLVAVIIFSLLFVSTFILTNFLANRKNSVAPVKSQAMDCSGGGTNDDPECDQQVNPCHFSCNSNPQVIPSCCDDIKRTGDPFQCCFAARRVCRQDQCDGIPPGVVRQRCGQMWQNNCCPAYGSGCPFTPPENYVPPVTPTPPAESAAPSPILPTQLPTNLPVIPTDTLASMPTNPPVASPTLNLLNEATQVPANHPIVIIPTTYIALSPTAIPTPTNVPVMEIIGSNIGDFWQKTKESFLKFISSVLP